MRTPARMRMHARMRTRARTPARTHTRAHARTDLDDRQEAVGGGQVLDVLQQAEPQLEAVLTEPLSTLVP